MSATYEVRGDVAVISLNNPPVNGLGYETRRGIAEGLERAASESGVKAIVITGAGKAFSGGADIREFGSPKAIAEPNLLSVIAALEALYRTGDAALREAVAAAMGAVRFKRSFSLVAQALRDPVPRVRTAAANSVRRLIFPHAFEPLRRIFEARDLPDPESAREAALHAIGKIGTVGLPLPGNEVRIGEDGEVLVRGTHVMRGYHGREDLTAEAFEDGAPPAPAITTRNPAALAPLAKATRRSGVRWAETMRAS